jgi:hypothetical protein
MTVKEIVEKWFDEQSEYDGLYSAYCGCVKGDLFPCSDCETDNCTTGYLQHHTVEQVQNQGENDDIECDGGEYCQCIGEKK